MRFIGPDAGRMVILYSPEEVRTDTSVFGPYFIGMVQERYHFVSVPDPVALRGDFSTLTFRTGRLDVPAGPKNVTEFTMVPGGVIVDAITTDDCEQFIEDFILWGMESFRWNRPSTIRARLFSSIVVEFENEVGAMLGGLEAVCEVFSAALRDQYGITEPYSIRNLVLSADPMALPSSAIQTDVTVQRRTEIPFSANRFYCTGPFRTTELATLMERAEHALSKNTKRK